MINQVNLARPLKNQHSLLCENHVLPKTVFTKYNKKIRKWVFGGSEREALKVKTGYGFLRQPVISSPENLFDTIVSMPCTCNTG